jgi:uncharacterized protein (DUF2235 family)
MGKNILIFSDGTGQAGGLIPDELRSNVYKLYRATRCDPDSFIPPAQQMTFYDPGLGTQKGSAVTIPVIRRVYNFFSSAMGIGITRNIIDCYSAILQLYEEGDQIFLFGFSRGAYTVRCVGGVLGACGVPRRMEDGSRLKRDPLTVEHIATEAVKNVYQYGSSIKGDPFKPQRLERARKFRRKYGSGTATERPAEDRANVVPYFIGVWDTVAAIGTRWHIRVAIAFFVVLGIVGVAALLAWALASVSVPFMWSVASFSLAALLGLAAWYVVTHFQFHPDRVSDHC